MSHTFELDKDALVVREKAVGSFDPHEFIEVLAALEQQVPQGAALKVISDLRDVEADAVHYADVVKMKLAVGQMLERLGATSRTAIVVSENLQYGLARMYSMVGEDARFEVRVFRAVADAEVWLDL